MVSDDDFIDLVQTDRDSLVSKVGLLQIEVLDKLLSCACPQDRIGRWWALLFGHALYFVIVSPGF